MAGWLDKYQEGGEIDAVTSESAPYWQIPIKQRQDFKGNFLYNRLSGKEGKYAKRYRDWETDRKSTRLNSSHSGESRMPSSA